MTPPEKFRIEGLEELPEKVGEERFAVPLLIALTEKSGFEDLFSLLHLAAKDKIKLTPKRKNLNATSMSKLKEMLVDGDFYPWPELGKYDETIRPFGLVTFAENGGLMKSGKLTRKGQAYLDIRDPELLLEAFERWVEKGQFDEFDRVTEVKGRK